MIVIVINSAAMVMSAKTFGFKNSYPGNMFILKNADRVKNGVINSFI